jgi:hypothetical protein
MATYPESIRARLLAWQEDRREFLWTRSLKSWRSSSLLKIAAPTRRRCGRGCGARYGEIDGLDWDEVCGLESDDLGDCNGSTHHHRPS